MACRPLPLLLAALLAPLAAGAMDSMFHLPAIRPEPNHPFTITVEGNVGAGKSTLLNFFHKYREVAVHKEPLDKWQNLNGTDFLGLMISDPSRWGLAFESLVTLTMAEIHMADHPSQAKDGSITPTAPVKVMERSLHSARKVFMENLREALTQGEMAVLDSWYDLLLRRPEFDTEVDVIVYLRTSPQVAYERMQSRARSEEATLPLEHFKRLHALHEAWLVGESATSTPVIVIDADMDISVLQRTYRRLARAVWRAATKV